MELGMVGLGRMGGNMVVRLLRKGHKAVAFDRSEEAVARAESEGAIGAHSLEELVEPWPSTSDSGAGSRTPSRTRCWR